MSLETGNRIADLVPTNPVGATDFVSQGDDHIRLIKACIQGSFPSLGSTAVARTAEELNGIKDASNLTSGTLPDGRFPATLPVASGVNLTALVASNIGSGTLDDARLSSNVPLKNAANTFTAAPQAITANNARVVAGDGTYQAFAGIVSGDGGAFGTLSNHITRFYTNSTDRGNISAAGNWTINAPGSGDTLTLEGGAALRLNAAQAQINAYSTTALEIVQRENAPVLVYTNNSLNTTFAASGGVQIGSPTGGDKGAGTLNTAGAIYQNNVAVPALPAVTSTSTTLVKGQAHYITGNATLPELAAGEWVSIINNSGSAITISESSGYTTYWTASGASVSSVTLAARGRLFAEGVGSSVAYVSGDISGAS